MTLHSFINGRILTPGGWREDSALLVREGTIIALAPMHDSPADAHHHDLQGAMLLPGFIDVQVNGGGGVQFNDDPSPAAIAHIAAAHRTFGTTGLLPTLITDRVAAIHAALDAVETAIAEGAPGVLGLHLEGPFLCPERAGIHRPDYFLPLDDTMLALLTQPRRSRLMVTLAPDCVPPQRMAALARAGVILSLGHSNATYEQARAGFAAGATGVTHLFNAMSPLMSRMPGLVGAALESHAFCGIIVDGQHVAPAMLRMAYRAKTDRRFMLITDAMQCVGGGMADFAFQGRTLHAEGQACFDDHGRLAGSALTMDQALRNTVDLLGIDLATASHMASSHPAHFLGLDSTHGQIAPGFRADMVICDDNLQILKTYSAEDLS